MFRSTALVVVTVLAACSDPGSTPAPSPLGDVQVGVDIYPIEALDSGTWRVKVDGKPVICSRPTQDACYWSVRHYLTAQSLLDDLG